MDQATRDAIRANLFPAAQAAVEPWEDFPWHRGGNGSYQTQKRQSSQALAIDVLGTIKVSSNRDLAMAAIAEHLGVSEDGPWELHLEWEDRERNRLQEKRRSQIDAVAFGRESLIFYECKFTERDGGACTQTNPLSKGPHKGKRQCNGNYERQRHPVTGREARCTLTGKGIRYWEAISEVFDIRADVDHQPCPFAGPWFQWMRNLVLCHEVAQDAGLRPVFVIVYADAPGLAMAEKTRRGEWSRLVSALRTEAVEFRTLSFQRLIEVAHEGVRAGGKEADQLEELSAWVARKIDGVAAQRVT